MYNDIVQGLKNTHRNMERVLTLMRLQLDAMQATNDPETFVLLDNAVRYMRGYPALVHHPCEEGIFNRLTEYSPTSAATCARLIAEHKQSSRQELDLLDNIRCARDGDPTALRRLQAAGALYCAAQAAHIHNEETDVFPQAIEHFSETDWRDILDRMVPVVDELFQHGHVRRYDNLYERLMSAAVQFSVH